MLHAFSSLASSPQVISQLSPAHFRSHSSEGMSVEPGPTGDSLFLALLAFMLSCSPLCLLSSGLGGRVTAPPSLIASCSGRVRSSGG